MTADTNADATPEVLVIVGTDYHDFARLVGSVDVWAERTGTDVLIQYGKATPPSHARGVEILGRQELQALLEATPVIVSHGGPATIADIRAAGNKPIVMPREGGHDEAVDDHQLHFCRRMGASDLITLTTTVPELEQAIDAAVADPSSRSIDPSADLEAIEETVRAFAVVAADATQRSLRRRRRGWLGRRP